jgi:anti-sigma regulatory factor (Ser/Thr protein kinase)
MKHLEFASHPANLALVRQYVRDFVSSFGLSEREIDLIVLGVDEACTNIIRYAYDHQATQLITLSCESTETFVRLRLRDFGAQSDPSKLRGRPLEAVEPGGLGLHMMREAFDKVDFNLKKEGTELVLMKTFAKRKER